MKLLAKALVATLFTATLVAGAWAGSADPIRLSVFGAIDTDISTIIIATMLEKLGYTVELSEGFTDRRLEDLEKGRIDMSPEVWLLDSSPDEQKTAVLGPLGIEFREGWIFPSYMADRCPGLPNYEALYDCAQAFATEDTFPKGRLITYPPDWGTQSRDLVAMLKLPFEPVAADSEAEMITEFQYAARDREPVLMMFWEPHRIFAEFDLDWVTWDMDEGECVDASGQTRGSACGIRPDPASVVKVANRDVAIKWPGAYRLLAEMTIDNATVNALSLKRYRMLHDRVFGEGGSAEKFFDEEADWRELIQIVEEWIAANEATWSPWLDAAQAAMD